MAVSVKLDSSLEERLRRRAAATNSSTSDVLRRALREYLSVEPAADLPPSAHELGKDLFGRFSGSPNLSKQRKPLLTQIWSDKRKAAR